jgi:FAD-dependent urate hydroxylase
MAVKFFESKHEVRFAGAGLRVSSNAFQALQHLGIGDQVIQEGKVLDELRIYYLLGKYCNGRTQLQLAASMDLTI